MNWPRAGTVAAQPVPDLRTARPPTATITVRFGLCGAPRRGQRAGRAGGEGCGGATDQRLPGTLLYHGQRRVPGAELGSRHGDLRRAESCSGLIGEPAGAGRAWRGAGHAGYGGRDGVRHTRLVPADEGGAAHADSSRRRATRPTLLRSSCREPCRQRRPRLRAYRAQATRRPCAPNSAPRDPAPAGEVSAA